MKTKATIVVLSLGVGMYAQNWQLGGNNAPPLTAVNNILGTNQNFSVRFVTNAQQRMFINTGVSNSVFGGNNAGYISIGNPPAASPLFNLSVLTASTGPGDFLIGGTTTKSPNSFMGMIDGSGTAGLLLPAYIGSLDNSQPGPAISTIGNITVNNDQPPGVNNTPVHRFIVGTSFVPFTSGLQGLNEINNRVAFTWQNAGNTKMLMNAAGRLRIGNFLSIPGTLPRNRVEITSSFGLAPGTNDPYFGSVNGSSGLRFTNLTSANTPLANAVNGVNNTKVLSVDQNGDVVLVTPAGVGNGDNGLSLSGPTNGLLHLGQSIGAAGNPAQLLDDREVPMNDFNLFLTDGAQSTNFKNRMQIGNQNTFVFNQFSKLSAFINSTVQLQTGIIGGADSYFSFVPVAYNPYYFTNQANRVKIGVLGVGNQTQNSGFLSQHIVGVEGVAYNQNELPNAAGANALVGVLGKAYSNQPNVDVAAMGGNARGNREVAGCGFTAFGGTKTYGGRFISQGGSVSNIGVFAVGANNLGFASPPSYPTNINIGIYGASDQTNGPGGVPAKYAGYFDGDVYINGTQGVPGFALTSDAQFKTNVDTIANPSTILKQLKPKAYYMDTLNPYGMHFGSGKQYGFIAQDVAQILPELVSNSLKPAMIDSTGAVVTPSVSYKALNYNAFFALLTAAMQKQQTVIDSLHKKDSLQNAQIAQLISAINTLSSAVIACCSNSNVRQTGINGSNSNLHLINIELSDENMIVLNQNVPNPFAEQTTITYNVPQTYGFAQIIFKTIDGKLIKAVDITTKGKGQLNVFANDLSKGIYVYSLIVDGKLIDTKKMVRN
jgi:hypothetical protein